MVGTAAAFTGYGLSCLYSEHMKKEFKRFGLNKWRILAGVFQLIGALGLVLGVFYSLLLGAIAALGLALLMLLGFITRLRIKDGILESAPALIFMFLNLYLSYCNFRML